MNQLHDIHFYLLVIWEDVESSIRGPYANEHERDRAARWIRNEHGDSHGIYLLDIDDQRVPHVYDISGGVFEDPDVEEVEPDEGILMCLERGNLKAEWEDLSEGYNGDYDPDNPDDCSLLRFTVYASDESGEWGVIGDASYCTRVPASTPRPVLREMLECILNEFWDALDGHLGYSSPSVKKLGEELSHISVEVFSTNNEDVV